MNLITGLRRELVRHLAAHMDVNALDAYGLRPAEGAAIEELAVENVKRLVRPPSAAHDGCRLAESSAASRPYHIGEFLEIKTVWHPIGA